MMADEIQPAAPVAPVGAPEVAAPAEAPVGSRDIGDGEGERMEFVLNAFDVMNSDLEEGEIELVPVATPPEPGSVTQVPVTPPAQTVNVPLQPGTTPPVPAAAAPPPAAQPSAVAQAPPQQAAPPQAPAPVAATEPQSQSQVFDQIAQNVAAQQEVFTKALAQQQYGITTQQAEAMGFMPEQAAAISELQAKVHVNVVSSMTQMLAKQMPAVVQGLLEAQRQSREGEDEFYVTWPQLKGKDKDATIKQVMQTYRQMNPNVDRASFIRTTGAMACAILGLPTQVQAQPQVPSAQRAPLTPGPIVRQPNGLPFQPVGAMNAPPSAQPQPQLSEWDRLARIISADDQGMFDN